MQHPNKNRLLEYFYKDGSESEIRKTWEHLHNCPECREYLHTLKQTCGLLDELEDEIPAGNSFELIIKAANIVPKKVSANRQAISLMPYFQIALAIPFILSVLYFFQSKLRLLSVWEWLQNIWIIKEIGSFGFIAVIFFLAGCFITLALAPALLLSSEKLTNRNQTYVLSWR
jgi:sensor histidine kinase YesM